MKALTLTQPYATLIAIGEKSIETRSWGSRMDSLPFPMAIHAAKGMDQGSFQSLWERGPISEALGKHAINPYSGQFEEKMRNWHQSPLDCDLVRRSGAARSMMHTRGKVVAYATVTNFISVDMRNLARLQEELDPREFEFGWIDNGRVLWVLENVEPVEVPYSLRGAQGLWSFLADSDGTAADYIRRHGFDFESHKY